MQSVTFYRIFEAGVELDLESLESLMAQSHSISRGRFSRVRPKSIILEVPPLLVNLDPCVLQKDGLSLRGTVRAKIFDIGAISISITCETGPDPGSLEKVAIAFPAQDGLDPVFNDYLKAMQEILKPSVSNLEINPEFYEDYTVYLTRSMDLVSDPLTVLMGEGATYSSQMRSEILKNRLSYSTRDTVIVSWDSALIYDEDDPSDLMDLIEFANVQLLELRYYDNQLTRQMEKMYEDIESADRLPRLRRLRQYHLIRNQLMAIYGDITEIIEKINNLIKITEDIYYARVYETTLKVLRSTQWTESVNRKMNVILQNYNLLSNEVNVQHSNFLEWMIIILIALEFGLAIWQSLY